MSTLRNAKIGSLTFWRYPTKSLQTLAIEINSLNDQANYHAGQAVVYAVRCGEKLALAKQSEELATRKDFAEWLELNCRVKLAQAYNYIALYQKMPELLDTPVQRVGLPSMRQAIALLSAPEEIKQAVTEKIEAGETVTVKEIQRLKAEVKAANDSSVN